MIYTEEHNDVMQRQQGKLKSLSSLILNILVSDFSLDSL